jgi:hypothetical protein
MRLRLTPAARLFSVAAAAWLFALLTAMPAAQTGTPAAVAPKIVKTSLVGPHKNTQLFLHSDNCVACHNNLASPAGEDVSIGTSWRSTMMANSARDPYWHASVRREVMDHAAHGAEIQDECAACHMPIAQRLAHEDGQPGKVFAHLGPAAEDEDLAQLAADGISCTVCHQISSEKLGTPESFNGGFVLKPTRPDGVREIFGPFEIDRGRRTIMRSVTHFEQVQAPHIRQSEVCATCHTLITQAYGPDGRVIGSLPEQMNYQEWQHSDFIREGRSCQSCHMPKTDGPIRVSSVLGESRESLSRHLFVGGNAFMVRLLNRFRIELGVPALSSELEATARATERQLQQETATLSVSASSRSGQTLSFDVDVRNLTGHKFPTGYPARRTWLHVTVRDQAGRAVFESGAINASGLISGNDNDADGARFEPHYDEITAPDQVQIYESILGDPAGRPTTGLLTAVRYLKDNRLLPRGFDKATADPQIGVFGVPASDATFAGGGDRVRYQVNVANAQGPLAVEVELRYQPIGYRWAHNLDTYDAPEPKRFVGYYQTMAPSASTLVQRVLSTVP